MSTNLNYKQVANVTRRTWDVETYEKRAQARQQQQQAGPTTTKGATTTTTSGASADDKQEFRPADKNAVGPEGSDRAFLKARATAVMPDLEAQVGQTVFVDTTASSSAGSGSGAATSLSDGVTATGVGWHCKVCDCYLKDSHTYLDHINGRKHQRKLGYSMRVQRSSADDVKAKLAALQQKKKRTVNNDAMMRMADGEEEAQGAIDFEARVQEKDQALRERQEERRRRRKERKQKAKQQQQQEKQEESGQEEQEEATSEQPTNSSEEAQNETQKNEDDDEEEPQVDPALAAMMGFSGFGGSSKN